MTSHQAADTIARVSGESSDRSRLSPSTVAQYISQPPSCVIDRACPLSEDQGRDQSHRYICSAKDRTTLIVVVEGE